MAVNESQVRQSNKVIHGAVKEGFMKWWHLSLVRGAIKNFLEVKGVNQDCAAPETLREKCLERRNCQQQHEGENNTQNGHWCGGWKGLSGLESVGPASQSRDKPSKGYGFGRSLVYQDPACSNLTTRGGTRAKVDSS